MIIPKTLAKNSGYDPQEAVVKLQVIYLHFSIIVYSIKGCFMGFVLVLSDRILFHITGCLPYQGIQGNQGKIREKSGKWVVLNKYQGQIREYY